MVQNLIQSPSISVVMPVFNGATFLREAMQSILQQTFCNFEFIIIDDGSTDQSNNIIHTFKDNRIILHKNKQNVGNYASRNIGMQLSRGKYICVMDADDIALPIRLEKQYKHMEANREVGICGSFVQVIPNGGIPNFLINEELLKVAFLSNNYCVHPSLIMRKAYLQEFDLKYNEDYYYSADFDLCARGFQCFKIQIITDVLLQYRRHAKQISTEKYVEQQQFADKIRINQLINNFHFKIDEIPIDLHLRLMKMQFIDIEERKLIEEWVIAILERNYELKKFDEHSLMRFLNYLLKICTKM